MKEDILKILVVDDEEDIQLLFRKKFKKDIQEGKFLFRFATSANAAIQYLNTLKEFDMVLVLSDIKMPGMNGIDLLKIVKTQYPHLKVMMITAYDDLKNREDATRLGALDFIAKPVNFEALRSRILQLF